MKKPIKLTDVAKAAGVSHGTASNVFSRPEIVREEVRERVLTAAQNLGYAGPNPFGRMLRAGKVNAIGVAGAWPLAYFFEDPFARTVMSGISEVCDARGAGISLISVADHEELAWSVKSALVDGFIMFCMEGGPKLIELARDRKLPFIALDFGGDDETISSLHIDDAAGARLAARHLVELGHRRFAVLSLPIIEDHSGPATFSQATSGSYSGTRARIRGYADVLAESGITIEHVPIYETENDEATVRAGLDHLFAAKKDAPTAILAMSDRIALAALTWLDEHGLSVPGDVSVVGFDGVPDGLTSRPPLTSIAQPMVEMGRRAAEIILQLDGKPTRERMPLELIVRASTGAPK